VGLNDGCALSGYCRDHQLFLCGRHLAEQHLSIDAVDEIPMALPEKIRGPRSRSIAQACESGRIIGQAQYRFAKGGDRFLGASDWYGNRTVDGHDVGGALVVDTHNWY